MNTIIIATCTCMLLYMQHLELVALHVHHTNLPSNGAINYLTNTML